MTDEELPKPPVKPPHVPRTRDEEIIRASEPEVITELTDPERLARIHDEFERGFKLLEVCGPSVCVFGSARTRRKPRLRTGQQVGAEIGTAGATIITGGGPGAMEAANRGASEVGTPSRSVSTSSCPTSSRRTLTSTSAWSSIISSCAS